MKTRMSAPVKTPRDAISAVRAASVGIHFENEYWSEAMITELMICCRNGARPMASVLPTSSG